MKIDNVLSIFDGMSCGQIALKDMGIIPKRYYASEIDKHAIAQTQLNFPNTIQLGSVVNVDVAQLEKIDLLIGGSPCQSFSFAGKRKGMSTKCEIDILTLDQYLQLKSEGFEFEGQSYLFWEYMRILTDIRKYNPDVLFLLENVEMGSKWERILSEAIGVFGVHINSALVSAQNRKRIYWFGQNRERFYFSENYCYLCDKKRIEYEKKNRRIQNTTQRKGEKQILGNSQRGQVSLCDMQQGISENRTERYNKNLFKNMPNRVEKDNRQESRQSKDGGVSKEVLSGTQSRNATVRTELQENIEWEIGNEESRFKFIAESQKENENSFKEGDRWYYSIKDKRFNINPEYEAYMYCVCCGKELDHRPYNSVISYGDKRDNKSPSTLSKMQFEEARQNNGRIYDIYSIGVKGQDSMFGETITDIPQPKDKGLFLKDILDEKVNEKYYLSDRLISTLSNRPQGYPSLIPKDKEEKASCLVATMHKIHPSDNFVKQSYNKIRRLTPTECARLQTIPDWYKWNTSDTQQYRMLGNGWTIEVIKHIFKYL